MKQVAVLYTRGYINVTSDSQNRGKYLQNHRADLFNCILHYFPSVPVCYYVECIPYMVDERVEHTPDSGHNSPHRERRVFVSAVFRDTYNREITTYLELTSKQHSAEEIDRKIAETYKNPEQAHDFLVWIRSKAYAKRPGYDAESQGPAPKLDHINISLPDAYPIDRMGQLLENYDYHDPKNPSQVTKFLFRSAPPHTP